MHELMFADSAMPEPHQVLGISLRDYTVKHELVLLRQRSPFLCLSLDEFNRLPASRQQSALVVAVQLCGNFRLRSRWWWARGLKEEDFPLAIAQFRNYLIAGRAAMPLLSARDEADREAYEIANKGEQMTGGRTLGAPTLATLITFGLITLRLDYEDVLSTPFGYLANLYFAHLESNGQVYVQNADEQAAKAEMAAQRADVRRLTETARREWQAACARDAVQGGETARQSAYQANPRIGNVFAQAWYDTRTPEQRARLLAEWGQVAVDALAKAGIDAQTAVNEPIPEHLQPDTASCPDS